jgi:hypothetical protein
MPMNALKPYSTSILVSSLYIYILRTVLFDYRYFSLFLLLQYNVYASSHLDHFHEFCANLAIKSSAIWTLLRPCIHCKKHYFLDMRLMLELGSYQYIDIIAQ